MSKETQPGKTRSNRFSTGFRVAGALFAINAAVACDIQGVSSLPLQARKESLSSEEQARALESGIRLDGDGFISIHDVALPEDVAVETSLKPDSLKNATNVVLASVVDANGKFLAAEGNYTIFSSNYFSLGMRIRDDLNGSVEYGYFTRMIARNNPDSSGRCKVKSGYSKDKKVSVQEFERVKDIRFEIQNGDLKVSENGKNVGVKIKPENYTLYTIPDEEINPRRRGDVGLGYEYKIRVLAQCGVGSGQIDIGGRMLSNGDLLEPLNGEVNWGKVSDITSGVGQNNRTIAEFDARNGLIRDLTGKGDIGIVGKVSIK